MLTLKTTIITVVVSDRGYTVYIDGGQPLSEEHKRTIYHAFREIGHYIVPQEAPPQP